MTLRIGFEFTRIALEVAEMIDMKTLKRFSDALRANVVWERFRPKFEAWENGLPDQFTLAGCAGHPHCPIHRQSVKPMVFVRDHSVPGLYRCSLSFK
jgi:hypothetical protein